MHLMRGDGKDYSRKWDQGRASNEHTVVGGGLCVEQEEEGVRTNDHPP